MPNHWHLIVWPKHYGQLSEFTGWLTLTRMQQWHAHRHSAGSGHFYQGRFKPFPVQSDEPPNLTELRPYYEDLIAEFFPEKIAF